MSNMILQQRKMSFFNVKISYDWNLHHLNISLQ